MSLQKKGLAYWGPHLDAVVLPCLSTQAARQNMLEDTVSLQAIERHLERDPPTAMHLLFVAQKMRSKAGEIRDLPHALHLLGLDRVQRLLQQRFAQPLQIQNPAHRQCLQAISISLFAAHLAARWTLPGLPNGSETMYWLTLLLGWARWKIALAAPEAWQKIDIRCRMGERRTRIEAKFLGCTTDALNLALLKQNGFPIDSGVLRAHGADAHFLAAAARHAWEDALAPELPADLARWLNQNEGPALLAHLLAWSAHDSWHSGRTRALLRILCARRREPLNNVIKDIHEEAVVFSRQLAWPALVYTPAEQFFWPPPAKRRLILPTARKPAATAQAAPRAAVKPVATVAPVPARGAAHAPSATPEMPPTPPPSALPAPKVDLVRLRAFVRRCEAHEHTDINALMADTAETLEKALGLRRCLVFLKPVAKDVLGCFFSYGFGQDLDRRRLVCSMEGEHVLARLMRKSAFLWVKPENLATALPHLPENLRPWATEGGLMLSTLPMGNAPGGVIWADAGALAPDARPTPEAHEGFKVLSKAFGQAFTLLTARMRQKTPPTKARP